MTVNVAPVPPVGAFLNSVDLTGNILAGGTIQTFLAGTTTPLITYSDPAGSVPNPTTIPLNSASLPETNGIYLDLTFSYKFIWFDAQGNQVDVRDNISGNPYSATSLYTGGTDISIANNVVSLAYPQTGAEIGAGVTPTNLYDLPHNLIREGAVGNGSANDSPALQKAFNLGNEGFYRVQALSNLVAGGFKLGTKVSLDYTGQGLVENKGISLSGPAILYPNGITDAVIAITTDQLGQQDTRFVFENLYVNGDGSNYPALVQLNAAQFVTIRDIVTMNAGPIVQGTYPAAQILVDGVWSFGNGNANGLMFDRCHDVTVDNYHSFGNAIGLLATGTNNAGADGGLIVSNIQANSGTTYGISLSAIYTPMFSNGIVETNPVHFHVANTNFGMLNNFWFGPATSYALKFEWASGITNDFWKISNIDTQNESDFVALNFSNISNLAVHDLTVTASGGALHFASSTYNSLSDLIIRNDPGLTYSLVFDATCGANSVNGGRYEYPIYLKGNISTRIGQNVITPNYLTGVHTDDSTQGTFRTDEYVRYFDGSTLHETFSNGVTQSYLCPYIVATGSLALSSTTTFNLESIVPVPTNQTSVNTAEFLIVGGVSGSASATKVTVVVSENGIAAALSPDIGTLGSFSVSVSSNIVTLHNVSGSAAAPYRIILTKINSY